MDTAPPPLPPDPLPPPNCMPQMDSSATTVAHDRDLYCLSCGYNLRGLAGDPLRCPECGGSNPVGLIQVPAELITEHIKRMENSLALSALGGLLTLPIALFFGARVLRGDSLSPSCVFVPLFFGVVSLVSGLISFRILAGARPGWLIGAFRYYALAVLTNVLVLGALGGAAYLAATVTQLRPERDGPAIGYVLLMITFFVLAILTIRWAGPPLRRKLLDSIEPMRREAATSLTREYLRSRQEHERRSLRQ
jgi:hypothetical protein